MKETKIEKLILDLSNRWDCSPQEAVDRLNSMNESEINKLINSMTKKFQMGGYLSNGMPIGNRMVMSKTTEVIPSKRTSSDDALKHAAQKAMEQQAQQLQKDADRLKQRMFDAQMELMDKRDNNSNLLMQKPVKAPVTNSDPKYYDGPRKPQFKNGGMIDCLRNGGSFQKCKCGDKVAKGAGGVRITQQQDVYPEMTVKRNDGVNGTFKREYDRYNNRVETLTQRRPDGLVMATTRTITPDQIDTSYTSGPINGMDFQQYVTPTKYKGMNFLQKMFNKIVPENWDVKFDRYKNGGELKKCGGSLKKKK